MKNKADGKFIKKIKALEESLKNEEIKNFERALEENGFYINFESGEILSYENSNIFNKIEDFFNLVKSYPLYENQKKHTITYLKKDFTIYIHSEEEYEIKKCIEEKKMLLENLSDTTRDKKLTRKRRL